MEVHNLVATLLLFTLLGNATAGESCLMMMATNHYIHNHNHTPKPQHHLSHHHIFVLRLRYPLYDDDDDDGKWP